MFLNDDTDTAKLGDRLIAAVIAAFLGFWIGGFFGMLSMKITGSNYGLAWLSAAGFGLYGFLAPSRSTELWSRFWTEVLSYFSHRR
ncbi:hypothetical protein F3N42_08605 [Marinihelvus fidelis]|uniref:Uncharacterized protein n=1 Tax=Marinihelvus fidelis TaxID=2613842 RepID=A0A5N0T8W0_9GAMM|nr:hypothetical protein [Marinihelvus fidelis]KAA9131372.1 hypothetical protein F3N42_08605 [Marinihelvus fidelis]